MKPWYKEPYRLQDAGYCGMPQNARAVFHGLYELLMRQPVLTATIPQLASWMSLTRDGVRRSLEAVQQSGLIDLQIDGSHVTASLPESSVEVAPKSRRGSASVAPKSRSGSAGVVSVSRQGSADVVSVSRPCSVASSNDAGLEPVNLPLEENRIDKNRKEEKRIEAQSAADKPHNSPSQKVKKTTTIERPADCDETVWRDWLRVRGRNPLTQTAWSGMTNEASKAGISPAEAVRICAERGWRGFRADWLDKDKPKRGGWEPEDLSKQDYRSHDGEEFVAGSAAEYFYGKDYVRRQKERYERVYDRSKEELA